MDTITKIFDLYRETNYLKIEHNICKNRDTKFFDLYRGMNHLKIDIIEI